MSMEQSFPPSGDLTALSFDEYNMLAAVANGSRSDGDAQWLELMDNNSFVLQYSAFKYITDKEILVVRDRAVQN